MLTIQRQGAGSSIEEETHFDGGYNQEIYDSFSRTKKNLPFSGLYEAHKPNVFHNTQQIAGGVLASNKRTGTFSGSMHQPNHTQNPSASFYQASISTTGGGGHNLSNQNLSQNETLKAKPMTAAPVASKKAKNLPITSHTGQEFYSQKHQPQNVRSIATAQPETRQQTNG